MSKGDAIALAALLVAVLGIPAAWLAIPDVQTWWTQRGRISRLCLITLYVAILIGIAVMFAWPAKQQPSSEKKDGGVPVTKQLPAPRRDGPSASPLVEVGGSTTPIPQAPAEILIDGKNGKWPIDSTGQFNFRIQAKPGDEIRIRILEGNKTVYDGYQFLSGKPLKLAISEGR